jgi:hypothetical protein
VAIDQQRALRSSLPAIHEARAGHFTAEGPDRHAVDDRRVGVEPALLLQQPRQVGMESVPDASLLPGPEAAVGDSAGAAELRRHILPVGAGRESESGHPHGDPGPSSLRADGPLGGK